MKKYVLRLIALLGLLTCLIIPVAAYANSHIGAYEMTGGIFYKRSFSSGTVMTITVTPYLGTPDCMMGIYTARDRGLLGWTGADLIKSVSSVSKSVTDYTTKANIDGIYFRNWSGELWRGEFKVEW